MSLTESCTVGKSRRKPVSGEVGREGLSNGGESWQFTAKTARTRSAFELVKLAGPFKPLLLAFFEGELLDLLLLGGVVDGDLSV